MVKKNIKKLDSFKISILNRVINPKRNQNVLIAITGPTGSGKSYSGLSLAEDLAYFSKTSFSMKNIVFSAEDFVKLLNSNHLKGGGVVLYEEAGVAMNSKRSMGITNVLQSFILQTFRFRNLIVIFTTPEMGFMDKTARLLLHYHLKTDHLDYKTKIAYLKLYLKRNNPTQGREWRGAIKSRNTFYGLYKIHHPSVEITKEYEVAKNVYSKKLNGQIEKTLSSFKQGSVWGGHKK